jgi:hypothetical protein
MSWWLGMPASAGISFNVGTNDFESRIILINSEL